MTRDEIIKYMKQHHGSKVTHEYFSDDEYIYMEPNGCIRDENHYLVEDWYSMGPGAHNLMRMRKGGVWEEGWNVYGD